MITKAWKYEIYPTEEQRQYIDRCIGCCRWVWNWALDLKDDSLQSGAAPLGFGDISKMFTVESKDKDLLWLGEVANQPLRAEINHLKDAFSRFFKMAKGKRLERVRWSKKKDGTWEYRSKGYPRFKSKYGRKQSFSQQQNTEHTQNRLMETSPGWGSLSIPKLKGVKVRLHRPFMGTVETVTISKTPTDRYFCSVVTRMEGEYPIPTPVCDVCESSTVGIDRGIRVTAAISAAGDRPACVIKNPKNLNKVLDRLRVLQRRLQRKRDHNPKWKDSEKYKELRKKVSKLHEKVASRRADHLHKATSSIVNDPQVKTVG